MSKKYRIHIDSRDKIDGTTNSRPSFHMTEALPNCVSYHVLSCVFVNTLYNVRKESNVLRYSTDNGTTYQTLSVPSDFYSPESLKLLLEPALGPILFDNETKKYTFVLSSNIVIDCTQACTLRYVLGLPTDRPTVTGNFQTNVFFSSPMYVSFICDELHSTSNVYCGNHHGLKQHKAQPLHISPVTSGHNEVNLETNTCDIEVNIPLTNLSSVLHFHINDSYSNVELLEIGPWAIEILLTCT